jgi:hypothetical protein
MVAALALPRAARADRTVHVTVTVDGKKTLTGSYKDSGNEPASEVWFYLERIVLYPEEGIQIKPVSKENLEEAVLTGDIRVTVEDAGEAKVKELNLFRTDEEQQEWHIQDSQIKSMGMQLGFERPETQDGESGDTTTGQQAPPRTDFPWPLVIVAVLVFIAAGAGLMLFRRADRGGRQGDRVAR